MLNILLKVKRNDCRERLCLKLKDNIKEEVNCFCIKL